MVGVMDTLRSPSYVSLGTPEQQMGAADSISANTGGTSCRYPRQGAQACFVEHVQSMMVCIGHDVAAGAGQQFRQCEGSGAWAKSPMLRLS